MFGSLQIVHSTVLDEVVVVEWAKGKRIVQQVSLDKLCLCACWSVDVWSLQEFKAVFSVQVASWKSHHRESCSAGVCCAEASYRRCYRRPWSSCVARPGDCGSTPSTNQKSHRRGSFLTVIIFDFKVLRGIWINTFFVFFFNFCKFESDCDWFTDLVDAIGALLSAWFSSCSETRWLFIRRLLILNF